MFDRNGKKKMACYQYAGDQDGGNETDQPVGTDVFDTVSLINPRKVTDDRSVGYTETEHFDKSA